MGYATSYEPIVHIDNYSSNQFEEYLKCMTPNYQWHGMYISGFKALDSYLIVQHNSPFTDEELSKISYLVDVSNELYQSELENLDNLVKAFK